MRQPPKPISVAWENIRAITNAPNHKNTGLRAMTKAARHRTDNSPNMPPSKPIRMPTREAPLMYSIGEMSMGLSVMAVRCSKRM